MSRAPEISLSADNNYDSVKIGVATLAVQQTETFVANMHTHIFCLVNESNQVSLKHQPLKATSFMAIHADIERRQLAIDTYYYAQCTNCDVVLCQNTP